jgi:hypothetical protein
VFLPQSLNDEVDDAIHFVLAEDQAVLFLHVVVQFFLIQHFLFWFVRLPAG